MAVPKKSSEGEKEKEDLFSVLVKHFKEPRGSDSGRIGHSPINTLSIRVPIRVLTPPISENREVPDAIWNFDFRSHFQRSFSAICLRLFYRYSIRVSRENSIMEQQKIHVQYAQRGVEGGNKKTKHF